MTAPRTASRFGHLSVALAGVCLTIAEMDFLPELQVFLLVYLVLLYRSHRTARRFTLPAWAANVLGVVILVVTTAWVLIRFRSPDTIEWLRDVPLPVAIMPYLGPLLMALLLVRVYRPHAAGDFWVVQGLGLLQVGLGCVLASGTLFGIFLLLYFVTALCALAAHEGQVQLARSAATTAPNPPRRWRWFCLRWALAVAVLAVPLFVLTPRIDGPEEWDPFSRFFPRKQQQVSHTGFAEEIDLTRGRDLVNDNSVAFTVSVSGGDGSSRKLPPTQRWRGVVLDRYEEGVWRSELNWPPGKQGVRTEDRPIPTNPELVRVEFRVPGKGGGLFLAEPVRLTTRPGTVPVWVRETLSISQRNIPLFFETEGTIVSSSFQSRTDFRYTQVMRPSEDDRYGAVRLREPYLGKLLRVRVAGLEAWTRELLLRLTAGATDRKAQLRELLTARTLPGEALPPAYWEDVARLLCAHLAQSGEYTYSYLGQPVPPKTDPVFDFLTERKQGACERFASALALMLRAVGVPARVMKGFRGADETGDGAYQVLQSQAHAWVEVLVPASPAREGGLDFDWLALDPTPSSDDPAPEPSTLARWWQFQQTGQALWQDLILGYSARQQAELWEMLLSPARWLARWPWLVGGLVVLTGVGWYWLRRRRRERVVREGSKGVYERLCDVLARHLGMTPLGGETPRELAARAETALAGRAVAAVPGQVVALFYRTRYGGLVATEEEVAEGLARIAALEAALWTGKGK